MMPVNERVYWVQWNGLMEGRVVRPGRTAEDSVLVHNVFDGSLLEYAERDLLSQAEMRAAAVAALTAKREDWPK